MQKLSTDTDLQQYKGRHGFIVKTNLPGETTQAGAEVLSAKMKELELSNSDFEFWAERDGVSYFIYPESATFESGEFYKTARRLPIVGVNGQPVKFSADTLTAFLN